MNVVNVGFYIFFLSCISFRLLYSQSNNYLNYVFVIYHCSNSLLFTCHPSPHTKQPFSQLPLSGNPYQTQPAYTTQQNSLFNFSSGNYSSRGILMNVHKRHNVIHKTVRSIRFQPIRHWSGSVSR